MAGGDYSIDEGGVRDRVSLLTNDKVILTEATGTSDGSISSLADGVEVDVQFEVVQSALVDYFAGRSEVVKNMVGRINAVVWAGGRVADIHHYADADMASQISGVEQQILAGSMSGDFGVWMPVHGAITPSGNLAV